LKRKLTKNENQQNQQKQTSKKIKTHTPKNTQTKFTQLKKI